MKKFEVNKSYKVRFIGDSDLEAYATVTKRTAKFVTVEVRGQEPKRCKVYEGDEGEFIYPMGKYSMCPVSRAENVKEEQQQEQQEEKDMEKEKLQKEVDRLERDILLVHVETLVQDTNPKRVLMFDNGDYYGALKWAFRYMNNWKDVNYIYELTKGIDNLQELHNWLVSHLENLRKQPETKKVKEIDWSEKTREAMEEIFRGEEEQELGTIEWEEKVVKLTPPNIGLKVLGTHRDVDINELKKHYEALVEGGVLKKEGGEFVIKEAVNYGLDRKDLSVIKQMREELKLDEGEAIERLCYELDILVTMENFKGTKGNWEIEGELDDLRVEVSNSKDPKSCDNIRNVCKVVQGANEIPNYDEAQANARLIVNAKKLLKLAVKLSKRGEGDSLAKEAEDLIGAIFEG